MIFSTSGIVLRSVKYGDTSSVVSIYTRQFGIQSYLVNGVRGAAKNSKVHLFQPASVVELEVYHNQLKNLQRIKEIRWKIVYHSIFTDVVKNSIALFMVELLQKSIIAEEKNELFYDFSEKQLELLDSAPPEEIPDFPLKFMISVPAFLGFEINNNYDSQHVFFDSSEGKFVSDTNGIMIENSSLINKSLSDALNSVRKRTQLHLNGSVRRNLLHLIEKYYQLHITGFKELKSLKVVEMIFRK